MKIVASFARSKRHRPFLQRRRKSIFKYGDFDFFDSNENEIIFDKLLQKLVDSFDEKNFAFFVSKKELFIIFNKRFFVTIFI